jgi:hypothetical protein
MLKGLISVSDTQTTGPQAAQAAGSLKFPIVDPR